MAVKAMSRAARQHTKVISLVNGGFWPDKEILYRFSPNVSSFLIMLPQNKLALFDRLDFTQSPAELRVYSGSASRASS
jgi:hypothetical protein